MGIINEQRETELRDQYTLAAFIGWQTSGVGGKFSEYLKKLGLQDKPKGEPVPQGEKITAKEAIAKAQAILERAKAGAK